MVILLVGCSTTNTPTEKNKERLIIAGAEHFENASFNQFLLEDLNVAYTPTFIFVKDGKIVYFDDSVMSADKFNDVLVAIDQNNVTFKDSPNNDYKIANIGKDFMMKDFIASDGLTVLEIGSVTCPYTKMQLTECNPEIYEQHKNIQFVEYFLRNNQSEVDEFLKTIQ